MAATAAPAETPQSTPRATGYACELAGCSSWNASPHSACGTVYACPPCWASVERLTAIYQVEDAGGR
jgi:hypothetical protein